MRRFARWFGPMLALALTLTLSACGQGNVVPDLAFRGCLNDLLGRPADDSISSAQLRQLSTGPTCQDLGIESLAGAQYLTGVDTLILANNDIANLAPLTHLTKLKWLMLGGNQISDLSPLAGLTGLARLDASDNQVFDLSPLSNLTQLTSLSLSFNQVTDVTALKPLTALTSLGLMGNHIRDLGPVAQTPAALSADPSDLTAQGQSLTDHATPAVAQALPSITGLTAATWSVMRGDATITGDLVTYPTTGTVILGFRTDDNARFAGTVTVLVD